MRGLVRLWRAASRPSVMAALVAQRLT